MSIAAVSYSYKCSYCLQWFTQWGGSSIPDCCKSCVTPSDKLVIAGNQEVTASNYPYTLYIIVLILYVRVCSCGLPWNVEYCKPTSTVWQCPAYKLSGCCPSHSHSGWSTFCIVINFWKAAGTSVGLKKYCDYKYYCMYDGTLWCIMLGSLEHHMCTYIIRYSLMSVHLECIEKQSEQQRHLMLASINGPS